MSAGELPVRPAPAIDRDSRPWWDALARHEFVLQRCTTCPAWRWPARAMCGRCGSFDWAWMPASGTATVASWIVNHHQFFAGQDSPYTVVTVRLEEQEDLLLPGSVAGGFGEVGIGQAVRAQFVDCAGADGTTFTLLDWRPAISR